MKPGEDKILREENEALRRRLAEAEQVNEALTKGQIDAVVDAGHQVPLLLSEAQQALRGSEKRYRALFDESPLPKWLFDQETLAITDVNDAAVHVYGYSREEFLSKTMRDIWHPDQVASAIERVAATTFEPWSGISRHVKKDGANLTVEVFSHPIHFAGRHYQLSVIRDITERQRAAERLRESEERIRFALRSANVGIWDMEPATGTAQWSEILEAQYGLEPGTFEGNFGAFLERIHPDDRSSVEATVEKAMTSGGDFAVEHRAIRPDGTVRTLNNIGHVYLGEHGASRAVGISIDITDRRRLEEQFRHSQKMEAVGRLAGGVAHDFNNLLTVILGYSDVLLQGVEPGPMSEAAQEIGRAGDRAAALTRQLLAFSRKQTLIPEVLDMGGVIGDLSTMVKRLIGEEIDVRVVVSPGLGRVKADRGQLEQVVMNLAVNARDAMPKGGSLVFDLQNVELDATFTAAHVGLVPGPYVLLAISDTGTGMDAATKERIFEPFFTTKEAAKGTGLGLSTVHGIVLQSGGAVDVSSEPGQGTTFKIYLPRVASDVAVSRSLSGIHPKLPTGSGTILVVEDEAAILQLTNLILQKAGYTVLLAKSPAEAELIAGGHPEPIDLLMTDVVMPGMRGPELAERVLRKRPDLRVLYMSGYTDDAIAHHGFVDAGMAFLQKPFTPLGLIKKVHEALGGSEP